MLIKLRDFLCGWYYIEISRECGSKAMDILYREGISFRHHEVTEYGIRIIIRKKSAVRFMKLASESCVCYKASVVHGIPVVLDFIKHRPVIPIGLVLAGVWIMYSTHIVWDIRITGNDKTPSAEIVKTLDELGFGIGTYFPNVDFNSLHSKYLVVQDDIAWLSVYMDGTVADIQVRELYKDERYFPDDMTYANIVAECTAVVESVNVFEGQATVKAGDIVREGQVLISGVVEKKDGGIRYEYAKGEVICRVAVPMSVEIKTDRDKKAYTGREKSEKTIKIFKKSINLFRKGGIEYASYDKISTMEQLCPFGICTLPVWIEETVYREYDTAHETISADDATAEAMSELSEKIKDETVYGELLGKEVTSGFSDGIYRIDCLLTMRRDVGRTVEFTTEP